MKALVADEIGRVWVVGEISNLRRMANGHHYFTLKDDFAQIRAALFARDAGRLSFVLEDGLEVIVGASCSVYEARGDLQLIVRSVEPRGQGALQLAFEQLRARLETEGLFDAARKRTLPPHPRRVGVVTSLATAALRDVLKVSGERAPGVPIVIAPAAVQGDGSAEAVAAALDALSARAEELALDVVLVVRGGGSLEDLHAFNTELVARAIARSRVPVVCGVGHQTDVTIADLVADVRAPTPSAAAMAAFPDVGTLVQRVDHLSLALARGALRGLERERARLARLAHALARGSPAARLARRRARLDALGEEMCSALRLRLERDRHRVASAHSGLARGIERRMSRERARLSAASAGLDALSPLAVLGRGYALVRRGDDGALVRRAADCAPGDALHVRLAEGALEATVRGPAPAAPGRAR